MTLDRGMLFLPVAHVKPFLVCRAQVAPWQADLGEMATLMLFGKPAPKQIVTEKARFGKTALNRLSSTMLRVHEAR
jgi:hypothetical protein